MYKMICSGEKYKGKWWVLSEGSNVRGSPEDKQPSGPCVKGSAKILGRVTLALYTGTLLCDVLLHFQSRIGIG